jgi:hypothetical protein
MQIVCPACGFSSDVADDTAARAVACANCRKRIAINAVADSDAAPPDEFWELGQAAGTYRAGPVRRRKTKLRSQMFSRSIIGWSVGVSVTVVLAAMAVLLLLDNHVKPPIQPVANSTANPATLPVTAAVTAPVIPWDRQHRAELLAIKLQAEALEVQGKWQDAYGAYQKVITTVGDHEITDPVVKELLTAVRVGQERSLVALIAGRSATTAPVVAAAGNPSTAPSIFDFPVVTQVVRSKPTTMPVATAQLDPAELAADRAPQMPGPIPPMPTLHAYTLPDAVTDEQIGAAINKGVQFLAAQFRNGEVVAGVPAGENAPNAPPVPLRPQQQVTPPSDLDHGSNLGDTASLPRNPVPVIPPIPNKFVAPNTSVFSEPGVDALCVYAILTAGRAQDVPGLGVRDPATELILDRLKRYQMFYTYHRSLRAAALAVFDRTEDNAALEEDVRWLQAASMQGAYTYVLPTPQTTLWDNSNSQYGLLGVWSGAQAGISVATSYWHDVQSHWISCVGDKGTWGYYSGDGSTLTMTCAGLASLLVASDYLDNSSLVGSLTGPGNQADQPSTMQAINQGLNWLDAGDNCMATLPEASIGGAGYGLYGLERVGLASGFKYFGKHDWYSELARQLVAEQRLNGSWGGHDGVGNFQAQTLIDTSYALLFLSRGRHPILFNKLRYDGSWNNRPHDVAHLARYAGKQLERPLNWQVVNLRRNWFDWMDSPVLYIAGDKPPKLTEADYASLRAFSAAGGVIFTHADGNSADFSRWVTDLTRKIFPKFELTLVPRNHDLYSAVYPLKDPPPLLAVNNGSRLLLVHSPTDLSVGWQLNWTDENKLAFQMGVNLFVYAAGKGNLKNRLASSYIPDCPDKPDNTRQVARLQYAGEWDPEPYAWTRFSRYFQWETHRAIDRVVVPMKDLTPNSVPMAVLTGTVRNDFTDAETAAARAYVQAGGILVIDACGGQQAFAQSIEESFLPRAFPGSTMMPIPDNHPLLVASRSGANDLSHPMRRGFANEHHGKELPLEVMPFGKGWVIFSRLDLTTGLLGTESWGILGYDPAYAQALMKNAVLWSEARSPVPPTTRP